LQAAGWGAGLGLDKPGRSKADRIAMMAITTNSSISVNPKRPATRFVSDMVESGRKRRACKDLVSRGA